MHKTGILPTIFFNKSTCWKWFYLWNV